MPISKFAANLATHIIFHSCAFFIFYFHSSHRDYETDVTSEGNNHRYKRYLCDSSRKIAGCIKLKDSSGLVIGKTWESRNVQRSSNSQPIPTHVRTCLHYRIEKIKTLFWTLREDLIRRNRGTEIYRALLC